MEFGQALIDDALRARTLDRGAVKADNARTLVRQLPLKSVAVREKLSTMAVLNPTRVFNDVPDRYRDDVYCWDCDSYHCRCNNDDY